jgi:twitching motility protein PilT
MDAHDRMFGEIAVRLELLSREQLVACRKAQAEGAGQHSLPQVALSLGIMSDAEVLLVAAQQRKVLERRREARDAAVGNGGDRPSRQSAPPRQRTTSDAVPTAAARQQAASQPPSRGSQPAPRPESRTRSSMSSPPPVPLEAKLKHSSMPASAHDTTRPGARRGDDTNEREPTVPHVHDDPRSLLEMGAIEPDLEPTPLDPHAGSEARARGHSQPPTARSDRDERPGKRTEVPPARARKLASPPPANTNYEPPQAPRGLSRGAGGTLLANSGRNAQIDAMRSLAPAEGSLRPAADRGWRNPSRPPPPPQPAASRPEPIEAPSLGMGPRGTLAWNPAPSASARPAAAAAVMQSAPAATLQPAAADPAPVQSSDTRYLDQLLALAIETGASDLHAHSGSPVLARVDGALWPLTADAPLTPPAAEQVIAEIMTDAQWDELQLAGELRFAYELPGVGRFRAHAYRQAHGLDVVFRALPAHIVDPKDLSLPSRMLMQVLEARSGLFVISGPPGSGKTTTLATLAHVLANEHNLYVATAESPIEIVHGPGLGLIEQREVPVHAHNFAECIEQARDQGADVIVLSELSTPSAIMAALGAALAGCAVLVAVPAESPWAALAQLLAPFAGQERALARAELALAIRAVFTQHLMARSVARGRIPAVEMLLSNPQVAQLIADEQFEGIEALMGAQHAAGMQTLETALHELVRARAISPEVAQRAARRERTEASSP